VTEVGFPLLVLVGQEAKLSVSSSGVKNVWTLGG
jgi:hypothetical protein